MKRSVTQTQKLLRPLIGVWTVLATLFLTFLTPNVSFGQRVVITVTPVWGGLAKNAPSAPTVAPAPTPVCAVTMPETQVEDPEVEKQILNAINAERRARRLRPLTLNAQLAQAARWHTRDMAANDRLDHTSSTGADLGARLKSACYGWRTAGENIAAGYGGDVTRVVKGWMNSPSHRAAILNREYTEAGIGYSVNLSSTYQYFYTIDFGARR
jgi:uncharacterized protein YkwD